jgi:CheY-like chemotaxis protein
MRSPGRNGRFRRGCPPISARRKPDVLIMDIGMPNEDGYQAIGKVRQLPSEEGGKVPAIALTAFARSEDRRRAILNGFSNARRQTG